MSESETKHTPGPWYLRTNRHTDTQGREWGWIDTAPAGGQQRRIPGVEVTWTRGAVSHANARLIAAAPELLEACELNETFSTDGPTLIEYVAHELERHHVLIAAGELRRMAELQRAAIHKARGE